MFEKHPWKSDIFSKDADIRPASLLKMSLFHRYFSNILLAKTSFYVSGILVENGLMNTFYCKIKTFDGDSNNEIKNKIISPDLGFLALHV